ncbi:type IV secretory system conjugative DNA transfer family protein [Kitasatospora sp. NPDC048194]|uniref:type IV secretory system conjugative DNA transfer family protein n=1 Tax=Kitasatospora sp. NPDC048194 TaxID=3364045 RepID=UPI0037224F8A
MSDSSRMDDSTFMTALGAGAVISLGAVSLAAGVLSGLLSGQGLPHMTSSVPGTALLSVAEGPGAVYSPAPPTWLFYSVFAVLVVLLGVLARVLVRRLTRRRRQAPAGGAAWGGAGVEREMALAEAPKERPDRLTAGRGQQTKQIVGAIERSASGIAFGPPGSAKTTGVVIPNAAEWQGPAIVTGTKVGDLEEIYQARRHLGPVWVIAPGGLPPGPWIQAHWSPVDYATDEDRAELMAEWQADAAQKSYDPKAEPWLIQARAIVAGLLLAARISGGGINDFRRWLALGAGAVDHVRAILEDRYPEAAVDYAQPWTTLHEDGVGSVQFTLNVLAAVWRNKGVRDVASRTDFTAEKLLESNGTLVLIASPTNAERFSPLFTSLIASVIHEAERRYERTGRHPERTLGGFIDEAGNMLRYPKLPNTLTTGRGMGVAMFTFWHSYSQLVQRMGAEGARTIISASTLRMLLPGLADDETLRYFSFLFGRELVERTSRTSSSTGESTSTQWVESDLLPVHQLRQIPDLTAIVLYFNRAPIRVNMRPSWRDADIKAWLARPLEPAGVSMTKEITGA